MIYIKPTESGAVICTYRNNPEFGYINLESDEKVLSLNSLKLEKRSTLLRAETKLLEKFCKVYYGNEKSLPGRIRVSEFLENELPENYKARLNKNVTYEEAIKPHVKTVGQEALKVKNQRVLRFSDYDASGELKDIFIKIKLELPNFHPAPFDYFSSLGQKTEEIVSTQTSEGEKIESQIITFVNTESKTVQYKKDRKKEHSHTIMTSLWESTKMIVGAILILVFIILVLGGLFGLFDSPGGSEWRRP